MAGNGGLAGEDMRDLELARTGAADGLVEPLVNFVTAVLPTPGLLRSWRLWQVVVVCVP